MSKKVIRKSDYNKFTLAIVAAAVALGGAALYTLLGSSQNNTNQSNETVDTTKKVAAYDAYANIPKEDIAAMQTYGEGGWDTRDPYFGFKTRPIVAVVHIDSIDGGRTFSPITNQYVYPQTYGKMTVLNVYKGDIKPGQQLNYERLGGIVSYDDYWNGLEQSQRDKRLYLNNGDKNPTGIKYVQQKFSDDIDIKVDTNYLVFITPDTAKDGSRTDYALNGMQYGLREVRGSGDNITVLNNDTKKWDKLGDVVKLK